MNTGKDFYNLLNKHKGEGYHLGVLVPKNNPNYTGKWDCAEFVSWGHYQLSRRLYGCVNNAGNPNSADAYTGYLARDANKLGKIVSVNEAFKKPGALLLRVAASGVTGHVVVSDGRGGTIEAHSTKMGVINSVVTGRRWDYGILIPGYNYEASVSGSLVEKPRGLLFRFTIPLMVHPLIKELQLKLNSMGFWCGNADKAYGSLTMFAVRQYQLTREDLVSDGEAGEKTLKALGLI